MLFDKIAINNYFIELVILSYFFKTLLFNISIDDIIFKMILL